MLRKFIALSLMVVGLCSLSTAEAQRRDGRNQRCDEYSNEYDYQDRCEQVSRRFCEYNNRTGCYVPTNGSPGSRCESRYDEYDRRVDCERYNSRCEYSNGCYKPILCQTGRGEYTDRYSCERVNTQGCEQKNQCWIARPPSSPTSL